MNKIAQELKTAAEELRLSDPEVAAVEHLKSAGFQENEAQLMVAQHVMEKEAASALVQSGINLDEAVKMVKAAGINLKELTSFTIEAPEADPTVALLLKAAAEIESLEEQLTMTQDEREELQKAASAPEVVLPESIARARESGAFSYADLQELQSLSPELLTKVASVVDQPWEMGSGVGMKHEKSDPILDFILGR